MITNKLLLFLELLALAIGYVQTAQTLDQIPLFNPDETFIPFKIFIKQVKSAKYEDFRYTKVESEAAFEQMRSHILEMYEGVTDATSFVQDKEYADCIKIKEQPSFRALGLDEIPKPPSNSKFPPKSRQCVPGIFKDADSPLKLGLKIVSEIRFRVRKGPSLWRG